MKGYYAITFSELIEELLIKLIRTVRKKFIMFMSSNLLDALL